MVIGLNSTPNIIKSKQYFESYLNWPLIWEMTAIITGLFMISIFVILIFYYKATFKSSEKYSKKLF